MRCLVATVASIALVALAPEARADIDAQFAADAIVGGGARVTLGGNVTPYASGSLYVDALLGSRDRRFNAPRLGPWGQVRMDIGDAWRSASAGGGLAVLVLGQREEEHLFHSSTLIVSFGAAYHFDEDLRANQATGRLAAVFGGTWEFRISRSFAFPTVGIFVHYHWVLDSSSAGNQHDVLVGLQFSAATPFGLPLLLSR